DEDGGRVAEAPLPLRRLGAEPERVAAQLREDTAEIRVRVPLLLARTVEPGERLDPLADVRDALGALPPGAADVQGGEVEVRCVLRELAVPVVPGDVAEADGGLLVAVRLVEAAGAPILDRRQLLAVRDVADEARERVEHAVLGL